MLRGLSQSTTTVVPDPPLGVAMSSEVPPPGGSSTSLFIPTDEERAQRIFEATIARQKYIEQQVHKDAARGLLDPNETPRGPPPDIYSSSMRSMSEASSSVSLVNPASLLRTQGSDSQMSMISGSSRRMLPEDAEIEDDDSSHDSLFDHYSPRKVEKKPSEEMDDDDDGDAEVRIASRFNLGVGHHADLVTSDGSGLSDHEEVVGSPTGSILPLSGRIIPIDGSKVKEPLMRPKVRRRGSSGMIRKPPVSSSSSSSVERRMLSMDSLQLKPEQLWDFHDSPYYVPGDSLRAVPSVLIGKSGDKFMSDSDGESDSMLQSQLEIENEIAMLRAVKMKDESEDIAALAIAASAVFSSSDEEIDVAVASSVDRGEDEVDLGRVDSSVFDEDYGPLPERTVSLKKSSSVHLESPREKKSLLRVEDSSVDDDYKYAYSHLRMSEPPKPMRSQTMVHPSRDDELKFRPRNPSKGVRGAGSESLVMSRSADSSAHLSGQVPSLSGMSASVSVPMSHSSFDESHASRATIEVVRRRMTAVAMARKKSSFGPVSDSRKLSEVKEEEKDDGSQVADGALLRVMTKLFPFHMIGPINAAEMASAESESTGSVIAEPGCDRSRWYCEYKFCETTVHGQRDTYDGVLCWISEMHGFDYILCDTCVLQWKIDSTVIESAVSPSPEVKLKSKLDPSSAAKKSAGLSVRSIDAKHRASRYKSVFEKLSQPESPFDTGAEDKNVRRGWLFKRGAVVKGYKKRFCVLQSNFKLYYYKSLKANNQKGVVDLTHTKNISVYSDIDFEIETPHRTWVFKAIDRSECADWVAAISILTGVKSQMRIGEKSH